MLLRPDATFRDEVTNQLERVFPRGMEWLSFESKFPAKEVFANSVLDPAVGVGGELAVRAFAAADWQNWISTTKTGLYELATRVGLPELRDNQSLNTGLSLVYGNISSSLEVANRFDDPLEMVPELLKNVALQVVQLLVGQNMILQTVLQVLAVAAWAIDVVGDHRASLLAKDLPLPPLQSEDPATDTWQVNRVYEVLRAAGKGGVVFPDGGVTAASNANYTGLFMPAYDWRKPWQLQHRETGVAAQQGQSRTARGPEGETMYNFDPGDGSTFGFMPGTTTSLRVLQASFRFYQTVRSSPVNRYTIRCRGIKKSCRMTVKAFDGRRDCRQCVTAESVWPVEGVGWAYGGAPLNATTPGENVGAFYPSTNKLLSNLLDMIAQPGPLLYTIDVEQVFQAWKRTFEQFWEFARSEWRRFHGYGWRGLISRLATLMTTYEVDGDLRLGGRERDMPLTRIANPREADFDVPFSASIFEQIIAPYCRDLAAMQLSYLDTVSVAYIPPGSGALYYPSGNDRGNRLADQFMTARRELLASTKRMLVDLRQVSDPEYRRELERVGVKASPVKASLHGSPGIGDGAHLRVPKTRAPRAPRKPRVVRAPVLAGAVEFADAAAQARPPRAALQADRQSNPRRRTAAALGIAAGGALLTAAGIYGVDRLSRK